MPGRFRLLADSPPSTMMSINSGIELDSITNALQVEGARSFAEAYDRVLDAIRQEKS
jgi:hypothetical protein